MTVDSLQPPFLCIHKGTMFTVPSAESLTTTTGAALRGGLFKELRIIDSAGREVVVKSARKLHGVGPLWGFFNILFSERIRVALDVEATGKKCTTEEVREIVAADFQDWYGWASREDFDQLRESVARAKSTAEILRLIIDGDLR